MRVEEYLRQGSVQEALQAAQAQVRDKPADAGPRAVLFQLLAVAGEWERALTQLQVLVDLDPKAMIMVRLYKPVLEAEASRQNIAAAKASPVIFGEPEPWMATHTHGNSLAAACNYRDARQCLEQARDAAPVRTGAINGAPFDWLADADPRFGPFLEAMVDGVYFWIPFFRIRQIRVQPPKHIRDLLWVPAGFVWTNGGEAPGFIFVRYPGTESQPGGELTLSRRTEWAEKADGFAFGVGQRLLATQAEDYPLLDIRTIEFAGSG